MVFVVFFVDFLLHYPKPKIGKLGEVGSLIVVSWSLGMILSSLFSFIVLCCIELFSNMKNKS